MTEYNGNFDVLVLGGGICAQSILFEMCKDDNFNLDTLKVAQISRNDSFIPCTQNTTSVVSLSGTSKGISELGDLIVDSFHYTSLYVKEHGLSSFKEGDHYFVFPDDPNKKDNFVKRYGNPKQTEVSGSNLNCSRSENFVVDSTLLIKEMNEEISNNNIEQINKVITDIKSNGEVICLDGSKYKAKKVICCLGAYSNDFLSHFDLDQLDYSKKVPGDFLSFKDCDFGPKSFVVSYGHHNLVYRAHLKTILIGGTTLKNEIDAVEYPAIMDQYEYYKSIFPKTLPEFSKAIIGSGMRHKGRKRRPYCGPISSNVYSIHGVYKNGYTFSFYLARKLLDLL
jgi:hypothetical protein